jgi:hypothetical protein
MNTRYEADVVAWANEQAALLRAGRFDQLDVQQIAQEIEDVGKSEQRELASRMSVLLMHLIKWQFQPQKRSVSWMLTIKEQRRLSKRRIERTPSLAPMLQDSDWIDDIWVDAKSLTEKKTGIDQGTLPEVCPWAMVDVLTQEWLPE